MDRRRLTRIAQVAIVLGGAAAAASALVDTGSTVRPVGGESVVTSGDRAPGDIRANNSPSLARDPTDASNLVVVNRVDTPRYGCGVRSSRDGGNTWRAARVPIPPGEQRKCFVPDAAFGADGTLHLLYLTLRGVGNVPHALWHSTSRDGGRTLSPPSRVTGELAFQPRLAVDPEDPRRIHATWLDVAEVGSLRFTAPGNPVVASRSDDGGRTWGEPVEVSSARRERVLAPSPAVGPDGLLYVLMLDAGDDRLDYEGGHDAFGGPPYDGRYALVLARSRDGGATWEESVVDDAVVPVRRFLAFLPPAPSLAVHRGSGRVHVAFHDGRLGDSDVRVWTLDPDGGAWRGVRVNDTPRRDGTTQHLPRVAVAPGGRVDVVYYDRRADPRDIRTAVSLQSSFDGGRTFSPSVRLTSRPFDSRIGAGSERGLPEIGSRLALDSSAGGALAVWADTRFGTEASNKQDLVAARVAVSRAGASSRAARAALLWGGAALIAGALFILALTARR